MTTKYGYIRVSTKDQNEQRQVDKMKELGIDTERDLFIDKQSGKDFMRPDYKLLKRVLRKGDVLYIHSIDRLGRNKQMILEEWNDIINNIGADIVVIDMPLLDTTLYKDKIGSFISDLILQFLSYMAEEELERIKKRQREGIDSAKMQGKHLGRPIENTATNEFIKVYDRWKAGEITGVQAMEESGLKKATFYRVVKAYEKQLSSIH